MPVRRFAKSNQKRSFFGVGISLLSHLGKSPSQKENGRATRNRENLHIVLPPDRVSLYQTFMFNMLRFGKHGIISLY